MTATCAALLFVFRGASAGALQPASYTSFNDHGTFITTLAGERLGTEEFRIRSLGDRIEAQAVIHLTVTKNGTPIHFETLSDLILDSALNPLSYRWTQKVPESSRLRIDFGADAARVRYDTVRGRHEVREFSLPQDTVILDDNVIHQYELVAMRYDKTGGEQSFRAFIPQEGIPGVLTVENLGTEAVSVEGKKMSCRHLVVTTDLAHIDLWIDQHEYLQKLEIASSQLIVVRQQ